MINDKVHSNGGVFGYDLWLIKMLDVTEATYDEYD